MIAALVAVGILGLFVGVYLGGAGGLILAARRVEQADRRAAVWRRRCEYVEQRADDAEWARYDLARTLGRDA